MHASRKNDFCKPKSKSLNKNADRYKPINDGVCVFGGTSLIGPHISDSKKISFFTRHDPKEYFAIEILQLLGLNTPKIRFVGDDIAASRNIDGYIPMICFRDDVPVTFDREKIMKWRSLYKLDLERQVVIDLERKQECKLNGETFAANILFMLVRDCDSQVAGFNFGLKRVGNRFLSFAIDKDKVSFDGKKFEDLLKDNLFNSCTLDQTLTIAYRVFQSLVTDESGLCAFDKIFLNKRVIATSSLNKHCKEYCENFKKTASSFLDYCSTKYGKDYLVQFQEREKMRFEIATIVVNKLSIDTSWIPIIVNDLKAVYYKKYFGHVDNYLSKKNKKELINKLMYDLKQELGLFSKSDTDTTKTKLDASNKRKLPEEFDERKEEVESPTKKSKC